MDLKNIISWPFNRNPHLEEKNSLMGVQQRINELFEQAFRGIETSPSNVPHTPGLAPFPRLNVSENDKEFIVKAELPGFEENDIKLDLSHRSLTIRGRKKVQSEEKDPSDTYYLKEITYNNFVRTVSLPFDPDPATAQASFAKGILTISFPKLPEHTSAHSIPIQSS